MIFCFQNCSSEAFEADNLQTLKWYLDAEFAVHADMRGHTGGMLTLGEGAVISDSTKHKKCTQFNRSWVECKYQKFYGQKGSLKRRDSMSNSTLLSKTTPVQWN